MWVRTGFLALVCVCSLASADFSRHTGEFVGGGEWKMPDGMTGKWTSEVTITTTAEKGYAVKEVLTIQSPSGPVVETTEWSVDQAKNGFFNILTAGAKTGTGFCFGNTCQLDGTGRSTGSHYGEVLHFGNEGNFYRMGFDKAADYHVAWNGEMKKK